MEDRNISDAPLDATHVGPIYPADVGELLLGPTSRGAKLANARAETLEDWVRRLRHPKMLNACGLSHHGR